MFAVIFEVVPKPERKDEYLELGKLLRPEIEKIDGFMDNERFASQRSQGRVLSLSTWRDEKAVIRWRTLAVHHQVQEKGRFEVFLDYHLRVGEFTAGLFVTKRAMAPCSCVVLRSLPTQANWPGPGGVTGGLLGTRVASIDADSASESTYETS